MDNQTLESLRSNIALDDVGHGPTTMELRQGIEDIDSRIIDLLACRLSLSAQIGESKANGGEQVMMYSQELRVFNRYVEPLTELGLKRDDVVGFVGAVLEASRKIQQDVIRSSRV